jgi:hypothetical protein
VENAVISAMANAASAAPRSRARTLSGLTIGNLSLAALAVRRSHDNRPAAVAPFSGTTRPLCG